MQEIEPSINKEKSEENRGGSKKVKTPHSQLSGAIETEDKSNYIEKR